MLEPSSAAPRPGHGVRLGAALFHGDHGRLADEVRRLESAGLDFLHLDVFDGHFVSDLGFSPRTIAALRPLTQLPFEVHLGVDEPLRFMPALAAAGADLVLVHIENLAMPYETIFLARSSGLRIGLAMTLGTPLGRLEPLVTLVDAVLILSRVTGESTKGASFDSLALPRLRAVRDMVRANGATADVQVAGGIHRAQVADLVAAGASTLAMGGGIYEVLDMAHEVAEIRKLAGTAGRMVE
jgi:ribulose-phosphate 3-epimerase